MRKADYNKWCKEADEGTWVLVLPGILGGDALRFEKTSEGWSGDFFIHLKDSNVVVWGNKSNTQGGQL